MSKNKNQRIFSDDPEYLTRLAEDFEFIGRQYRLDLKHGVLIVFALPARHKKSPVEKKKRDKRSEKFERRA